MFELIIPMWEFLVLQLFGGVYFTAYSFCERYVLMFSDFNDRNQLLTAKLLKQGYQYQKFVHYLNSTTDTQS